MSFHIRRLEQKDKAAWTVLFKGYIAFYEATVADDVIEMTWQRLMAGTPDFHIGLVAECEVGKVVGFAHILFHSSTWSPTTYCYLEDLFVNPAMRAKGAGRRLIEAVYAEADQRKCTRTYWSTQEFNDRARGLYDQMATRSPFVQYRR